MKLLILWWSYAVAIVQMILDVLVLTNTVKARTEEERFWKKKRQLLMLTVGRTSSWQCQNVYHILKGRINNPLNWTLKFGSVDWLQETRYSKICQRSQDWTRKHSEVLSFQEQVYWGASVRFDYEKTCSCSSLLDEKRKPNHTSTHTTI